MRDDDGGSHGELHSVWIYARDGSAPARYPAASSSSRTRGATCVPYSSMLGICLSCGSVPLLYFMSNRVRRQRLNRRGDLGGDGLGRTDAQRAVRAGLAFELLRG